MYQRTLSPPSSLPTVYACVCVCVCVCVLVCVCTGARETRVLSSPLLDQAPLLLEEFHVLCAYNAHTYTQTHTHTHTHTHTNTHTHTHTHLLEQVPFLLQFRAAAAQNGKLRGLGLNHHRGVLLACAQHGFGLLQLRFHLLVAFLNIWIYMYTYRRI